MKRQRVIPRCKVLREQRRRRRINRLLVEVQSRLALYRVSPAVLWLESIKRLVSRFTKA